MNTISFTVWWTDAHGSWPRSAPNSCNDLSCRLEQSGINAIESVSQLCSYKRSESSAILHVFTRFGIASGIRECRNRSGIKSGCSQYYMRSSPFATSLQIQYCADVWDMQGCIQVAHSHGFEKTNPKIRGHYGLLLTIPVTIPVSLFGSVCTRGNSQYI